MGKIADQLITWYLNNHRELPWRKTKDPYAIWVSETMLQQTKVDTVIPFYLRFMDNFPTLFALSLASEEEVLKSWQGLGYYRRARFLHQASKEIVTKHEGVFPRKYEAMRKLQGIGDYTAGAIASIAFEMKKPAVDGNVFRVFSRLFARDEDISVAKHKMIYEELVIETMGNAKPSQFNQAIMELGALICSPKSPKCGECPLELDCQASQLKTPEKFPVKTKKTKITAEQRRIYWVDDGNGRILIRQRTEPGLLEKMWELPNTLEEEPFLFISSEAFCFHTKHIFSHRIWHLSIYKAKVQNEIPGSYRWVPKEELNHFPFATVFQNIIQQFLK
jgi:A/G-specific adenine glycosylase